MKEEGEWFTKTHDYNTLNSVFFESGKLLNI